MMTPGNCPLCKETKITATKNDWEEDWVEMPSLHAPEPWHQLIAPKTCANWPAEKVRAMGGGAKIAWAIAMAQDALRREKIEDAQFSLQVGPHAAQNLGHPHYHLYRDHEVAPIGSDFLEALRQMVGPACLVLENEGVEVWAGGHRTGECLLLPTDTQFPPYFDDGFAATIANLIGLYTEKFRSTKGLPPDYSLEICIRGGRIAFGAFIPILNQIGTMEWLALFMPKSKGWNLLWSHEETARYLRG